MGLSVPATSLGWAGLWSGRNPRSQKTDRFFGRCTMRKSLPVLSLLGGLLLLPSYGLAEPDVHDTRLLTQPAVSARHIAFIYARHLWVADLDGRNVRQLTTDIGTEAYPV